jgi:hypothetical protein
MQVCRYAGMQVCRYAGMQVCRYAGMRRVNSGTCQLLTKTNVKLFELFKLFKLETIQIEEALQESALVVGGRW